MPDRLQVLREASVTLGREPPLKQSTHGRLSPDVPTPDTDHHGTYHLDHKWISLDLLLSLRCLSASSSGVVSLAPGGTTGRGTLVPVDRRRREPPGAGVCVSSGGALPVLASRPSLAGFRGSRSQRSGTNGLRLRETPSLHFKPRTGPPPPPPPQPPDGRVGLRVRGDD
jgi:hypothetical protein